MSETRFTPGPWEAHTFSLTTGDRRHTLAHFGPISGKMRADSTRESQANCVLAAAAPELFEVLQQIVSMQPRTDVQRHWFAKGAEALAKARGSMTTEGSRYGTE